VLSDFKAGPPEGGNSCILYRLKDGEIRSPDEIGGVLEVKLWYDPKTLTPVKRIWEGTSRHEVPWIWTETYDEVVLDAPPPRGDLQAARGEEVEGGVAGPGLLCSGRS
jgi:hypothetical protein